MVLIISIKDWFYFVVIVFNIVACMEKQVLNCLDKFQSDWKAYGCSADMEQGTIPIETGTKANSGTKSYSRNKNQVFSIPAYEKIMLDIKPDKHQKLDIGHN